MTTTVDNDTTTSGDRSRIRSKASDAYSAARERTSSAYGTARESASRARQKTSEGIDSNPAIALIGGLAIGGLIAALLPKTEKEEELLGDYGRKINERAREAARAAKEASRTKLDELGYNRDTAREKIQSLKGDVKEIASTAAQQAKTATTSSQS